MRSASSRASKTRSLQTLEGRRVYDPIIDHLVMIRQRRGLRQVDVDDMIGCAERLVSKWECRDRYPSAYFLLLWAQALGVTLTIREEQT